MMQREAQWVPGNHPIPLDSAFRPVTLVAGSLAVFAVDRETSERLHLFSVECGEPLFPIACPAGAAWDICAVPLETSCLQPTEDVRKWEEIFALENWLTKIGEALTAFGDSDPAMRDSRKLQTLEPGRTLNPRPGERIAIESGVTLLHLEAGDGLLLGAPVAAGATVALVPGVWLETAGEATCKTLETGPAEVFTATIDLAVPVLFEVLDRAKRQREAADRARLAARREVNERISGATLETLAGIAGKDKGREPDRSSGDPLLDAVRAAARVLGVAASVRPAHGFGRRRSDAVTEIAQASGLRSRTVLLAAEWWRKDSGPLVTHNQAGNPVALLPCRTGYEIFDPAGGTRKKATPSTTVDLGSFAHAFYRPLPEDLSARGLLKHVLESRRRDLRTMAIAGAGAALLGMAATQGVAILITQAIPDADHQMVWQVGAGMFAAAFGAACLLFTQAVSILRARRRAAAAHRLSPDRGLGVFQPHVALPHRRRHRRLCAGDWAAAEEHHLTAIHQVDTAPYQVARPMARGWYALMLLDRNAAGDHAKARGLLSEALAMYESMKMPFHANRTGGRLASL